MKKIKNKQYGKSLFKTLFLIPILLIGSVVAYFVFCEARKAYWDNQVDLMCEKDGGIRVYEKDRISKRLYDQLGGLNGEIPIYSSSNLYFKEEETIYLHANNPQVRRSETHFKKVEGNKTLAVFVYYARVGGDFPSISHQTSHGCLFPEKGLTKKFIKIEGEPE